MLFVSGCRALFVVGFVVTSSTEDTGSISFSVPCVSMTAEPPSNTALALVSSMVDSVGFKEAGGTARLLSVDEDFRIPEELFFAARDAL